MRIKLEPLLLFISTFAFLEVALSQPTNDRSVRLRGYQELSKLIEDKMLTTSGQFSLDSYVGGGVIQGFTFGIAPLLGYYNSDPLNSGWRNVSANTASASAYLLALTAFATDLFRVCETAPLAEVDVPAVASAAPEVASQLKQFCSERLEMDDLELRKLWHVLTAGMVPEDEYEYWKEDLKGMANQNLQDQFEFMVVTAVMSPQVLFR